MLLTLLLLAKSFFIFTYLYCLSCSFHHPFKTILLFSPWYRIQHLISLINPTSSLLMKFSYFKGFFVSGNFFLLLINFNVPTFYLHFQIIQAILRLMVFQMENMPFLWVWMANATVNVHIFTILLHMLYQVTFRI